MGTFVAKTDKFWIEADPSLGATAIQSGLYVAQLCESDYNRLVQWFGGVQVPYRSPDTPGFIRVLITTNNGGWNNGTGGFIKLNAYPESESMGFVFVAELSEMFMVAQQGGWDPSNSKGEALSRLLSEVAYPTAPNAGLFFSAQSWLGTDADPAGSNNRHDWIAANEPTDQNFISIGCAILFLNYLRWQIGGISLESIVAATGTTLEAVYEKLLGQSGGFQPFSSLLNRFFPIGSKPAVGDNPFPLLDAAQRLLFLQTSSTPTGIRIVGAGVVEERFLGCPIKPYKYSLFSVNDTVKVTATPVGFGAPNFSWTVNGLVAMDGATIQPTVTVFRPNPALPGGGVSSIEVVRLTCAISKRGAVLSLTALGLVGQAHIAVGVVVNDVFETPSWTVNASATATIATENVQFEPAYYLDSARCAKAFINRWRELAPPFDRFAQAIAIILTLPDPPPQDFQRALVIMEQIASLTEQLRDATPIELREQLQRFLRSKLATAPKLADQITGLR